MLENNDVKRHVDKKLQEKTDELILELKTT
jgi:hypothetical protein